jgi:hypothetical protein
MQNVLQQLVTIPGVTLGVASDPPGVFISSTIQAVNNYLVTIQTGADVYVVPICEVVGVAAPQVENVLLLPPPVEERVGECACCEAPLREFLAANVGATVNVTTLGFGVFSSPTNATIKRTGEGIVILDMGGVTGFAAISVCDITSVRILTPVPDSFNIYVRSGAVGGNGSMALPFGTIPEGITAVSPNGTVHILAGDTYNITSQIDVNKTGITLLGEPGTNLLLQADLIPLMVVGNAITIQGLTITSDMPYEKEFIQIGGNGNRILNNTIFGPAQPLPMSMWAVNRAVVPQIGSATNLLVQGNTFYSLRSGMYINPNTTGDLLNNVVYNTKGGFLIEGAIFNITGNSWGIPANEFDIVLLPGTTFGPPYGNPPTALSTNNNNATISDQRV